MRLRQLSHLVALAEQGSFARAAQASHLTQPAFSRSIEALEQSLQARLIDRTYGAAHFTQEGELVLARARALLADAQRMRQEVLQLQGLEAGSLHVGLGPFAGVMLGRAALSALVRLHPRLTVHLHVAHAALLCERLQQRELDLFVADTRDLERKPVLEITSLPQVCVDFFARPGHPLLERPRIVFGDLAAYPVAGPSLPLNVAKGFRRRAGGSDIFGIVCDDPATLRHLALTTDAIILAPNAPAFERETKPLVPLRIAGVDTMKTGYGIVTLSGRTPCGAGMAFMRCVSDALAQRPARAATR